jgi:hypothetical protein
MNSEQWHCPNQTCDSQEWMVQHDPTTRGIWWVAAHANDRPFMVAATNPVCPRCGTTLLAMVELAGALAVPERAAVEPMVEFERILA